MTPSQGCAGGSKRSIRLAALAASGLCLAVATIRPASACHIHHDQPSTTHETAAGAATPGPSEAPTQALQAIMTPLDETAKPEPQVIATTPASAMPTPTAATPSVHDWHHATSAPCLPPSPPSTCSTGSTTASAQSVAPLKPPAVYLNPPSPAPEPSTILSALTLAGAFAWRRRAGRPRD